MALVGGPSWGKTPSMRPFIQATGELEADDEPAWKETLGAYERDVGYAKACQEQWRDQVRQAVTVGSPPPDMPDSARTPEPPARPRLRIADATVEEIGAILAGNPRGLLQTRDELAGWLGSMDRYGGNGADRAFYLECWNGGSYMIDRRKHSGQPVRLSHASLAILGGLQPDKLKEALAGADDGLAERFLYIWPAAAAYRDLNILNNEQEAAVRRRAELLLNAGRRLRALKMGQNERREPVPIGVGLEPDAFQLLNEIRRDADAKAKSSNGLAAGWYGKTPARALRLALVFQLLGWAMGSREAPEPRCITASAIADAGEYLDYAGEMLEHVLAGLIVDQPESDAAQIGKMLIRDNLEMVNERTLYQQAGFSHLRDATRRRAAFDVLIEAGFLQKAQAKDKGRPASDWLVNPALGRAA
jgi:hypothetical protein